MEEITFLLYMSIVISILTLLPLHLYSTQKIMMIALQTGSYVALKLFCLVVVALLLPTLSDNLLTDSCLRLRLDVDYHCYH